MKLEWKSLTSELPDPNEEISVVQWLECFGIARLYRRTFGSIVKQVHPGVRASLPSLGPVVRCNRPNFLSCFHISKSLQDSQESRHGSIALRDKSMSLEPMPSLVFPPCHSAPSQPQPPTFVDNMTRNNQKGAVWCCKALILSPILRSLIRTGHEAHCHE